MNMPASAPAAFSAELAALREIATGLAQPRQRIETSFVTVGTRLAEGAAMLNRISKVFEALPAELQSPSLAEASERLAEVGRKAEAISQLFVNEQADLARLAQVVAAADHPIAALRRAVKMMGIVAINARVVAASVVGDGDDFDVFTTDIATLSADAGTTIQHFTAAYRQLTQDVADAVRQRNQATNAQPDTLQDLAAGMDRALAEMARQRAISADGTAATGRVSRQIVGRIASAVMALQVGDSTRQRLEHIEAGLAGLCGQLETGADAEAGLTFMGGLQAAQLADTITAFETDVAEAGVALRELASDARIIMDQSRAIYGQGNGEASPLTALSHAVRDAATVLRQCEAERDKLEQVAKSVLATVGVLLGHVEAVQEIEANMRLVSLNAAVKCAQLGPRGAALNVIARQLRELTGETVEAAEAAMAGLHEAARLGQAFGAAANGNTAGKVGHLEQEASAALLSLQAIDGSLATALGTLNSDGPAVIGLLGDAADVFTGQSGISETLRDLEMQLVPLCPPPAAAAPPESLGPAIAAHRALYTMDAERHIHDQLLGAVPAVAGESTEADLDDIFF